MKNANRHAFPTLAALASLVLISGCAFTAPATTAIPDADSAGAQTYRARCGSCHALAHPMRLSYAGWQALLPVMEQRIQERHMEKLSDEERRTLMAYLKQHSR